MLNKNKMKTVNLILINQISLNTLYLMSTVPLILLLLINILKVGK